MIDNHFERKTYVKIQNSRRHEAQSSSVFSINKDTWHQISHFGDLVLRNTLQREALGKELLEVPK
jgi:hypothetical protein